MLAIKIQCGCGQKYAFDVEPVGGRMGYAVACPVCGADGTSAANAAIAQSLPMEMAMASPPPLAVNRLAAVPAPAASAPSAPHMSSAPAPSAAPRTTVLLPGQVDRATAEREARAKIFWGDSADEVLKFLMRNGFTAPEASAQVHEMFLERCVSIRKNGFYKIIYGTLMACVPVGAWFYFESIKILPIKFFALLIMVGLYGAYQAVKGTIMVIAPKSEPGDVASQ
jgi:hypothetical protein